MKFDVVIGNPPYSKTTAKKSTINGQKRSVNIFQYFQALADKLSQDYSCLIYPGGRWMHQYGKGMKAFGYAQMNDLHLKKINLLSACS